MSETQYIVIRTCNRPALLQRLLASLERRNVAADVQVLVFDDARKPELQQRNEAVVASAGRRFHYTAHYLGKEWQCRLIVNLCQQFPQDSDTIHWLLAERPPGVFSGGRLFNMIMLALAGHRFTLFDDDYTLDRARHLGNGHNRELECSRSPERQITGHLSVKEARLAGFDLGLDPIEQHLAYLGRRLQDCLESGDGNASLRMTAQLKQSFNTLREELQLDEDSSIITTGNGQYGIPIAPNGFVLFYQPADRQAPVWADPEKYRVLRQGRSLWSVTYGPVVSRRTGSTPSGIDNRRLMPPTLPHCKGEDTLFCVMVKYLHPNAAHLELPWALEHSRPPVNWPDVTFSENQKLMLAKIIWKQAEHLSTLVGSSQSVEDRLDAMSNCWLNWSGQPIAQLTEDVRNSYIRGLRWRISVMEDCLVQVKDKRLQVYRDASRAVETFKANLDLSQGLPAIIDAPEVEGEADRIRWLADVGREFGHGLAAWSRLWNACRKMDLFAA